MYLYSVNIEDVLPNITIHDEKDEENCDDCHENGIVYGTFIYPASLCLSEYIVNHIELFKNKRVLELGAGVGLSGLVCGLHGASQVIITDGLSSLVEYIRPRIVNNNLQDKVSAHVLQWKDKKKIIEHHYDVIIGSDVTYSRDAIYIPYILHKYLSNDGKCIIIHQIRKDDEGDRILLHFKMECKAYDLQIEEMPIIYKNKEYWSKLPLDKTPYYTKEQIKNPEIVPFKCLTITRIKY